MQMTWDGSEALEEEERMERHWALENECEWQDVQRVSLPHSLHACVCDGTTWGYLKLCIAKFIAGCIVCVWLYA